MMNLRSFGRSVSYAVRGIVRTAKTEQNFRIELGFAAVVIILMFVLPLSAAERAALLLATVAVLVLELMNSIAERFVDLLKPRIHHYVEEVKDIMAGAVLVASVGAAAVGIVIFWPHLANLFLKW